VALLQGFTSILRLRLQLRSVLLMAMSTVDLFMGIATIVKPWLETEASGWVGELIGAGVGIGRSLTIESRRMRGSSAGWGRDGDPIYFRMGSGGEFG
jgi:hypothetical protein